MIDEEGFRPNVGIILVNERGRVLWARRIGQDSWQFPHGGIRADEHPEQAMYRELREEIGLEPRHVKVMGCTRDWLRYRLPKRYIRRNCDPVCIGQKQIWYVLEFLGEERDVRLDAGERPEFDHWRWVHYWRPLREVVFFKRGVYRRALNELAPLVLSQTRMHGEDAEHSSSDGRQLTGSRPVHSGASGGGAKAGPPPRRSVHR